MPSIAIIGASRNRRKYGNKAVRAYQHMRWDIYPVHPTESAIEGLVAYKSIADVPRPIDRIALYLPLDVTLGMIADIAAARPSEVFFNPGSHSPDLITKARDLGINARQACAIVDIGLSPSQFP
jgi:predicted CoA-binding protein